MKTKRTAEQDMQEHIYKIKELIVKQRAVNCLSKVLNDLKIPFKMELDIEIAFRKKIYG